MNRLLLLDGMALAYRAFYAIRDLKTPDGRPTNALYGFIRMTQQLERQFTPTHWAVVFDGGVPEYRTCLLPTYKAQRPPMPDDLSSQLELLNTFLALSQISAIRMDGEEADDVLATLAARSTASGHAVWMATNDKDLFQIVSPGVHIVSPAKAEVIMGIQDVINKTGVSPESIPEWLALTGDTVDNIPGVPGVGPKTASKLLQQYGTVERMYAALPSWPDSKLKTSLSMYRDRVFMNVKLTTLRLDLPVEPDWETWNLSKPDVAGLLDFYKDMHFTSLLKEWDNRSLFDSL